MHYVPQAALVVLAVASPEERGIRHHRAMLDADLTFDVLL